MTEPTSAQDLFKGRHFDQEIIVLCVRWYLAYKLSSRDLVHMMAERGILLAHTTILRWVQRYVPDFEKRWQAYARPVGDSWRADETYIKVKGQWVYLYRAVDKQGRTVDFLLSKRRDVAAAKRFFSKATKHLHCHHGHRCDVSRRGVNLPCSGSPSRLLLRPSTARVARCRQPGRLRTLLCCPWWSPRCQYRSCPHAMSNARPSSAVDFVRPVMACFVAV
jgi:hypothetical protein